jgi:pyruvate formate-lyase activating enzyme-like uncharacterized protein
VEEFIKYLASVKADFININQLEFCPRTRSSCARGGSG